jgi:hypothetical protein
MAQAQQIAELIRSEHLSFAATGDPAGHATTRTDEPPAPTTPRPQLSVIQKNAPASSGVTGVSASWTCPVDSEIAPARTEELLATGGLDAPVNVGLDLIEPRDSDGSICC